MESDIQTEATAAARRFLAQCYLRAEDDLLKEAGFLLSGIEAIYTLPLSAQRRFNSQLVWDRITAVHAAWALERDRARQMIDKKFDENEAPTDTRGGE